MPLIRSIDILDDGIQVVLSDGTTHTVTSDDISAAQRNRSLALLNTQVTTVLQNRLSSLGIFVGIHIVTVVPLVCRAIVSDVALDANWWTR